MVSQTVLISNNDLKTETSDDAIHEHQPSDVSIEMGGGAQNIRITLFLV